MAIVRPFNGMRFTDKAGKIGEVCCPPYDIISEEQRKKFIKKNTNNVIRLELPGNKSTSYKKAKETLDNWLNEGVLEIEKEPCLYIYEEKFSVEGKEYSFKGIIGKVFLYEFEKGIILPHEQTLSKAKEDRFKLMEATACNFSQVYSLYEDEKGLIERTINKLTNREADKSFKDSDGVIHSLWVCPKNTDTDKISANMAGKKLYIADGHHRYETALRYRDHLRAKGIIDESGKNEADYIMMMLVEMSNPGLVVFPTHRIIHSLKKYSTNKILKALDNYFEISAFKALEAAKEQLKAAYTEGKKAFILYDGKKYQLLILKDMNTMKEVLPGASAALRGLDVSILHKLVLENLFGIDEENMANGTNLTYTRDENEAISAVDSGEANCCFILNPTKVEEIGAVAAAGEKMPQKSTYFYPKLTTGLVMNKLDRVVERNDEEENEKMDYVAPEMYY